MLLKFKQRIFLRESVENFTPGGRSWVVREERPLLSPCSLKLLPTLCQEQPETLPRRCAVHCSLGSGQALSFMDPHGNCHCFSVWKMKQGRGWPVCQPPGEPPSTSHSSASPDQLKPILILKNTRTAHPHFRRTPL